jgi:hypothetical protein
MSTFISKNNIDMLWEIVLDMDENLSKIQLENIRNSFMEELIKFNNEMKNSNKNLIEMNKTFIYYFLNNLLHQTKQNIAQQPKIEKKKENITFEEIQNDRMNAFERELKIKQSDFEQSMITPVPEQPNFKDKIDEPINEMEDLIAKTLAQRNFEIEQIQQSNIDKNEVEKWLKGEETSLKVEKGIQKSQEQKFKYIKIGDEVKNIDKNIIEISPKKNISWGDNTTHMLNDNVNNNITNMGIEREREREEEKNNIFSKLKQTTLTRQENMSDKYYLELKEDVYNLNQKIDLLSEQINKILTRTS